jgi:signal recognition particle subunit SRP54
MFESLTDRLTQTFQKLMKGGTLKEEHIDKSLREVREALVQADTSISVVKDFIHDVREKAIGQQIIKHLSPAQQLVKIVNDELIHTMGDGSVPLNFNTNPPVGILLAGLQGSGKTTSAGKLAKWIKENLNKSILLVPADVYRPAAIDQLKTLGTQLGIPCFNSSPEMKPLDIVKDALLQAKKQGIEVVIVDTAGRLHIDNKMMDEIKALHKVLNPIETLFVVDSMTGQDAANTAKVFNEALALTGVILTKTDGDSRGGAALSIRKITGKPIKFIGVGEKLDALEPFHPERQASRILGMGDVLSLIEEMEKKVDKEKAEKLAKKIQKGEGFDLADLRHQLKEMMNMGGIASMMSKLPGMGAIPQAVKSKVNDKELVHSIAILDSMTIRERHNPALIANSGSRKRRVAAGSGSSLQDINRVLKQHEQMQKMMKKVSKGGLNNMLRGLQGKLPPGMMPPGMMGQ